MHMSCECIDLLIEGQNWGMTHIEEFKNFSFPTASRVLGVHEGISVVCRALEIFPRIILKVHLTGPFSQMKGSLAFIRSILGSTSLH